MGRQHTTWISEENWKKLEQIGGDSISAKIGRAIEQADPDRELVFNAKMRQFERAKDALKRIAALTDPAKFNVPIPQIMEIDEIIEDVWWMVEE